MGKSSYFILGALTASFLMVTQSIHAQERYAAIDPDSVTIGSVSDVNEAPDSFAASEEDYSGAADVDAVESSTAALESAKPPKLKRSKKKASASKRIKERKIVKPSISERSAELGVENEMELAPLVEEAPIKTVGRTEKRISYETVPSKQREAFVERLEITRRILMKTGRAYDYKTMTLSELRIVAKSLGI